MPGEAGYSYGASHSDGGRSDSSGDVRAVWCVYDSDVAVLELDCLDERASMSIGVDD